jgi:hypothetical protein
MVNALIVTEGAAPFVPTAASASWRVGGSKALPARTTAAAASPFLCDIPATG